MQKNPVSANQKKGLTYFPVVLFVYVRCCCAEGRRVR